VARIARSRAPLAVACALKCVDGRALSNFRVSASPSSGMAPSPAFSTGGGLTPSTGLA